MSNTFTQEHRCTQCAYPVSGCRCPKMLAVLSSLNGKTVTIPKEQSQPKTVQTRAAALAPKPVVSAVLPANVAELRERMRRGEVVPLTGPGSLQEALAAPVVKSYQSPARKALDVIAAEPMPDDETQRRARQQLAGLETDGHVRAMFNERTPDGARMGDRIMEGILEATQQRFGGF